MFLRSAKIIVIAALVLSTGLHWAALQTVAWTTMFAANLGNESFSQAVSETFDGQHLCPLCKAIAASRKSQQKNEYTSLTLKMEFPPMAENIVLIPPLQFELLSLENCRAGLIFQKPLLPPPRPYFV